MRQPDNELRQQIEIAIASAQNVPFVGPNQQRIARSIRLLVPHCSCHDPLFTLTKDDIK